MIKVLPRIKGVILDIDGTLFKGETPLVDLKALFNLFEKMQWGFVVATNNTKSALEYQKRFLKQGIAVEAEHILTCAEATAEYLTQNHSEKQTVFVIGKEALKEEIRLRGFEVLTGRERQADIVVVGGDFDLNYEKLKNAILHIQDGARLIGTNPDILIPTEEGLVPEAGTTLAAIEAATGMHPIIIGKPEPILFQMAVEKMGLLPEQVIMVGDRLDTDIKGARLAGIYSVLVETGVDSRKSVESEGIHPDFIVPDMQYFMRIVNEGI
jgi:4-nitrophenyl phosphatase